MKSYYDTLLGWFERYSEVHTLLSVALLLLAAWIANWLVKRILVRGIYRALQSTAAGQYPLLAGSRVITRLANIVPALILSAGVNLIPHLPDAAITVVSNVCGAFIILTIALAIAGALNLLNSIYLLRPNAHLRPIKGYVQVASILVYAIATILIVATLIDRSPLILLSGLGAMAAVLLLIFQDTLLSLVASVQISSNDIIRVGDWVEMPQLNADGDVIDIALHTVKVQNWDKTITVIPTKRFISDSFKNWRGMQESGGRRIKRCLHLDQNSVHFLSPQEQADLQRFELLKPYLEGKRAELQAFNASFADPLNARRMTNLGTFRVYVERYLRQHDGIHQDMTLLVRQLQPGADGLPLEIYCFTNTTAWVAYEGIQSDIFDHLLAILPTFGLRVFQNPSGIDFQSLRNEHLDASAANPP
ncbi:mechanosensitive ion channel family protein [Aquipseudomonas ullengensis]|uniref:Mechanosensitive ion channel family protein n=1 Tax=Aquipseudomonas ullengensis TaxID=2759166 RepID=A0A7W4LM11_9GAMM|nr:mechanosensitive ion channel family protein [Pseudomonas ullengensis]MBB2495613.1 mechanosensitive ion channel family protein [Pseudomonas ullengensis]